MKISTRKGNCIHTNEAIGRLESTVAGIAIHDCLGSIRKSAEEKAIIMEAMERKRVNRPNIIFLGKDLRKSSSA